MDKKVEVSIIVPNYNREDLIKQTIDSVVAQTFSEWEMIIVDDGSSDDSWEIINSFSDPRIKCYQRNRNPKGAPTCRNIGLSLAEGKYVIFLDSDDLLAPKCLETRVALFNEYKGFDFLGFPMLIFKEKPYDLGIYTNIDTEESHLLRYVRGDNVWQTTQIIWSRDSVKSIGGFDESLAIGQETDLHVRALIAKLKYKNFFDLEPDCFSRQHDGVRIGNTKNSSVKADSMERFLDFLIKEVSGLIEQGKFYVNIRVRLLQCLIFFLDMNAIEDGKRLLKKVQLLWYDKLRFYIVIYLYKFKLNKLRGFYLVRNFVIGSYLKNINLLRVKYVR